MNVSARDYDLTFRHTFRMVGTDPKADSKRTRAVAGDVRPLFAPAGGRVAVMAYRPKVAQGAKPVTFRSPSGTVTMDKVEGLADVRTSVRVSEKSYRLAAAIPWSEIGLSPAIERFGLDLSVDFSDPVGQRNIARLHWGRNGAAIVYDLPTEARFEPESWGIGVLAR